MPLKNIIKKLDKYFTYDKEKLESKNSKIKKLLKELEEKRKKIKKELKKVEEKDEKLQLQRKLEAVDKLIKKTKKLI